MINSEFNKSNGQLRVLVAPLDWGLGHATRCIPIIYALQEQGCQVYIAADKKIKFLLQEEFPQLDFLTLPGYRIRYSKKKWLLPLKIFFQVPKLIRAIYTEHRWLKRTVKQHHIGLVISDNRFGLYHSSVPAVYITHQLLIKTGHIITERIAQRIHYRFIKKYNDCWIPDFAGTTNLAGELSHPSELPARINYIGALSRFEKVSPQQKKFDLLILLSGPEPQRSIFEKLLLDQLNEYYGDVLFIRGLPGKKSVGNSELHHEMEQKPKIIFKDHLTAKELNDAIQRSGMIICRSGYTTVMDLVKLQQKAILVPTPGQTEQEYLAQYLMEKKIFYTIEQDQFLLKEILQQAKDFPFDIPLQDMELYKKVVQHFVGTLQNAQTRLSE